MKGLSVARIVKEHDERLNEFLDTAETLFFSKGYEQTSVQDIINAIGVAKGTFYYYFDSKLDVLDAVVKRTRRHVLAQVSPIVEDTNLNALDKLECLFAEINQWKLVNQEFILDMLRMLYQDQNALLRLKFFEETRNGIIPPLAAIIEQGITERIFNVNYPNETAELILRMTEMPSSAFVSMLLTGQCDAQRVEAMKREIFVFNRSVERILGTSAGTFDLIKPDDLYAWLSVLESFPAEA